MFWGGGVTENNAKHKALIITNGQVLGAPLAPSGFETEMYKANPILNDSSYENWVHVNSRLFPYQGMLFYSETVKSRLTNF